MGEVEATAPGLLAAAQAERRARRDDPDAGRVDIVARCSRRATAAARGRGPRSRAMPQARVGLARSGPMRLPRSCGLTLAGPSRVHGGEAPSPRPAARRRAHTLALQCRLCAQADDQGLRQEALAPAPP